MQPYAHYIRGKCCIFTLLLHRSCLHLLENTPSRSPALICSLWSTDVLLWPSTSHPEAQIFKGLMHVQCKVVCISFRWCSTTCSLMWDSAKEVEDDGSYAWLSSRRREFRSHLKVNITSHLSFVLKLKTILDRKSPSLSGDRWRWSAVQIYRSIQLSNFCTKFANLYNMGCI